MAPERRDLVELHRRGAIAPIDRRAAPGGPIAIGQRVELHVSVGDPDDIVAFGTIWVTVDVIGEHYRGHVHAQAIHENMRPVGVGRVFAFGDGDVYEIQDAPDA